MTRQLILSLLALVVIEPAAAQSASDSVRTAFEAYKAALLAADGPAVVRTVDRRTLEYYGDSVDRALDADSATVADLGFLDRLMVFSMRHRAPADTVRTFDGATALAYGVRHGWIDGLGVRLTSIGDVEVERDEAVAEMLLNGVASPGSEMTFRREGDTWRLDLTSMHPQAERDSQKMVAETGYTEDGFITFALEILAGEPVRAEIWQPLGRR